MSPVEGAPGVGPVLARALAAFTRVMGRRPEHAARAPGRVNLIGEHTDYNGGFVLPIAINRDCVCVGGHAADEGVSRIFAADLDRIIEVDLRAGMSRDMRVRLSAGPGTPAPEVPLSDAAWARYPLGVIAEFRDTGTGAADALANVDMAIASAVPLGSGLSSSAALEAAVATLLEGLTGAVLEPIEKARLCRRAEHAFPGVPCGIMDPLASICGVGEHALLVDCRDETFTPIWMPVETEAVVLVANTNVHHALANGEYAKRRAACEAAARALGTRTLRDAAESRGPGALASLPDEQRDCAAHVFSEDRRTERVAGLLRAAGAGAHGNPPWPLDWRGTLSEIGELMNESHRSLSTLYRVSCPELDTLVELASALGPGRGVYGARMTGGGFGGCIVALVHPAGVARLTEALQRGYRDRHGRECTIYTTRACAGAAALDIS